MTALRELMVLVGALGLSLLEMEEQGKTD